MAQAPAQESTLGKIEYGEWAILPEIMEKVIAIKEGTPIWRSEQTKHEGNVLYHKLWNFWVRAGVDADLRSQWFFRDYEVGDANTDKLLADIGFPWRKAETEEQVWERIGWVWNWLEANGRPQTSGDTVTSIPGRWPSMLDYARYFVAHGDLVWGACFSKAHLFVTLLGRMIYPRFRFAIAEAHHTEDGAPPTASHVYGAAYMADRWFYLDPTAVPIKPFPDYDHRTSIGVDSFATVDYEHPYKIIPVPLSGFDKVPYLPKG